MNLITAMVYKSDRPEMHIIEYTVQPRGRYSERSQARQTCREVPRQQRTALHYDRVLADGLPIATGVIEGACRHLVEDRMGRTGARWSAAGAEAILRLRALRASGDVDDYWAFHLAKEYERTYQSRYADKAMPNSLPRRRRKLRLVK